MVVRQVQQINASRLRAELISLGMDARGARAELVNRLHQSGVYELNTALPPLPAKMDRVTRYPNHSSVLIGNGAQLGHEQDNKLVISNKPDKTLISGDFADGYVNINNCLSISNTEELCADTPGEEGDIRRVNENLYVYRSTYVHAGWYPVMFGPMMIV